MAHRSTHDPETRARLANVLSLAEAVAFFGRISPEMFVASMASLSVTGVMPVGKAEFRGRRA